MKVSVIRIGNSRGIRLPKAILEQLHVSDSLELEVENQQIILRPLPCAPRQGWDQAFRKMHEEGQDTLLMPGPEASEATEGFEWEW